MKIPFNTPFVVGNEFAYIQQAIEGRHLSGNGPFTKRCHAWLEARTGCHKALMTHSCTAALELAALLIDIRPGDEIIMPAYTFVSTANAFVLRGGVPVFVDIRSDTLNLDESRIEAAITERTKAIVPVHYAGVACEMDTIMAIAERHQLLVVEDAAQGLMASYKGRPLGSMGHLAAVSFHETKNIMCGEGGALLVNDERFAERAEVLWEKGTNRAQFFRGHVDKYTWVDIGSSFLPSEIEAAFLWAQCEQADFLTQCRLRIWECYHQSFTALQELGRLARPVVPRDCRHNAHMYYILLPDASMRSALLEGLAIAGINAVFHYVPLHSSPAGIKYGRAAGDMSRTDAAGQRLLRLPLWIGMTDTDVTAVVDAVCRALATESDSPYQSSIDATREVACGTH